MKPLATSLFLKPLGKTGNNFRKQRKCFPPSFFSFLYVVFSLWGWDRVFDSCTAKIQDENKHRTLPEMVARSSFPQPRDLVHIKVFMCGVRCPPHSMSGGTPRVP